MSWDVMIMGAEGTPHSLVDLPDDWRPQPMGEATAIRHAISAVLAEVDWSDPAWGIYEGNGFSIEFNIKAAGVVSSFTLHIRGGGDPLPTIVSLCSPNRWVALDYSTGELMDLARPSRDSWIAFQRFRDKVTGRS